MFPTRAARFLATFVFAVSSFFAQNVNAQPLAGTSIRNQARASFNYGNLPVTVDSNAVSVQISAVPGLDLQSDNAALVPAGAPVHFSHRLANTSNAPARFSLEISNQTGDGFDWNDLKLVRDANNNGVPDANDPLFTPADEISLQPGQNASFLTVGGVPTNATPASVGTVVLKAHLNALEENGLLSVLPAPLTAQNLDRVTVENAVALELQKSVSPQRATRGQIVTWHLSAIARGAGRARPIAVTVDGTPRSLVIVRDQIPANTAFVALSGPSNGRALYHRLGEAQHVYRTTPSAPVDAVAW